MELQKVCLQKIIEFSNVLKRTHSDKLVSNYYNQYDVNASVLFDAYMDEKNLCFGIDDNGVYRLYFISADFHFLNSVVKFFPEKAVLEYIYKDGTVPLDFSTIANLKKIDSFKRYHTILKGDSFAQKLDKRFFKMYLPNCTEFASLLDMEQLQRLLKKNFDRRVSHLPSDEDLKYLIANNSVIVCKQDGEIKTFWILKKEGKRIYSYEAYNSIQGIYMQSLWYKYFTEFKNENFREVYAWVSDRNFFSLNLHYKFSFTFDGMNLMIFETKFNGGGTKV